MKKITLIIMLFFCIACKSQTIVDISTFNIGDNTGKYFKDINNVYQNYVGQWENTTNNITFRLTLTKITKKPMGYPVKYYNDVIQGSYMIIENAGQPNENILCNSVKYYPQSGKTSTYVIIGGAKASVCGGAIEDTCATGSNPILEGEFKLTKLNNTSGLPQAQWEVYRNGITIEGQNFFVPTNVILTKVN